MIRLNKQECPPVLQEEGESWTRQLLEHINNGTTPPDALVNRYKQQSIKGAVKEDSFEKCIYCESKILHVYFGDIEHIKPKSRYPELTFDWNNLGYVCAQCNNLKRDKYDENLPFVDPFVDNPPDFLRALGHFIYHIHGNGRGEITEKEIGLNRSELIERRKERIDAIRNLADRCVKEINPLLKEALFHELREELSDDKPYSMCARSVFNSLIPDEQG